MSKIATLMQQAAAGAVGELLAIEDVFSTYLYTGNGSSQTITNGIDLAGEGGMTWIKVRSTADDHILYDTERGAYNGLRPNRTDGTYNISPNGLTSFNSDGFSLNGAITNFNASGQTYASWTFRKAPRFFDVVTYTGNGSGSGQVIPHSLGTTVGSIIVKRTDTIEDWAVYHRGMDATVPEQYFMYLNGTGARIDSDQNWLDTAPTDTNFTVGYNARVNASGGTYVAYLFAHDPLGPSGDGSDGLIACGSYMGVGSGSSAEVDLGWEPQWVMIKDTTDSIDSNWMIFDNMRGIATGGNDAYLKANSSSEEFAYDFIDLTSTGFKTSTNGYGDTNTSGNTYIYIAIRRGPMREPTSGTEVFAPVQGDVNGKFVTGFPVDFGIAGRANSTDKWYWQSRLQGAVVLNSASTGAELGSGSAKFDFMDGYGTGFTTAYYSTAFRRAPGFLDVVCFTVSGSVPLAHNLTVAPEMVIYKTRGSTDSWWVCVNRTGVGQINSTGAWALTGSGNGLTNIAQVTSTTFSNLNGLLLSPGNTVVAYLFATLPGVSKVGSYTGNGSSQTINCGFTGGARFVLIKRTDSTGDWYVWDTARGIVSGNDPHLSLNTTAAEVTSDDTIDPDSSGFIVNQVAATNVNVSSATYIYLAIA
jgi:hypothetical protein